MGINHSWGCLERTVLISSRYVLLWDIQLFIRDESASYPFCLPTPSDSLLISCTFECLSSPNVMVASRLQRLHQHIMLVYSTQTQSALIVCIASPKVTRSPLLGFASIYLLHLYPFVQFLSIPRWCCCISHINTSVANQCIVSSCRSAAAGQLGGVCIGNTTRVHDRPPTSRLWLANTTDTWLSVSATM